MGAHPGAGGAPVRGALPGWRGHGFTLQLILLKGAHAGNFDNPRMTRQWNRAFACIALAAMFSLALLPSLGRLGGTPPDHAVTPSPMATHAATCADMPGAPDSPAPPGHPPGSYDCDYCPLLAGLSLPAIPATAIAPLPSPRGWRDTGSRSRRHAFVPIGLGARGPPAPA